jgi:hypothetical protein
MPPATMVRTLPLAMQADRGRVDRVLAGAVREIETAFERHL